MTREPSANVYWGAMFAGALLIFVALLLNTGCDAPARAHADAAPAADHPDAAGDADPCAPSDEQASSLGCEFFAADLSNQFELVHGLGFGTPPCPFAGAEVELANMCVYDGWASGLCDADGDCSESLLGTCQPAVECVNDAQHAPFAIVIANPDLEHPVDITLSDGDGHTHTRTIGPGATTALFPQRLGFPDHSIEQSGVARSAYRVVTSRPVAAYQYSSLDNSYDMSAGASLLLPTPTLGQEYFALGVPSVRRRPDTHDDRATVTVIATSPGSTHIEVKPSADVAAGDGFAHMAANGARAFDLQQYGTLALEIERRGDPSGTRVIADQPIAVFAGHEGAQIVTPGVEDGCCADHLEDQLPPVQVWGRDYLVARSQPRQYHEKDLVRVLALRAGTTVTVDPPVGECGTLAAGGMCELWIDEDVHLAASAPVLVAHFLAGTGGVAEDSGDPSLAFVAASEQWRTDYTVLVPDDYTYSFMSITARADATVLIDGADAGSFLHTLQSGDYAAGRLPVTPGAHRISCDPGCGVELYGWDYQVSYMVSGGLGLRRIVE